MDSFAAPFSGIKAATMPEVAGFDKGPDERGGGFQLLPRGAASKHVEHTTRKARDKQCTVTACAGEHVNVHVGDMLIRRRAVV